MFFLLIIPGVVLLLTHWFSGQDVVGWALVGSGVALTILQLLVGLVAVHKIRKW
jgi:hypothetical protein